MTTGVTQENQLAENAYTALKPDWKIAADCHDRCKVGVQIVGCVRRDASRSSFALSLSIAILTT